MNLKIYCDGGAIGNPGPAAVGVVIQDEKGKVLTQFGKPIGHATNNIAEYMGVIEALKCLNVRGSILRQSSGQGFGARGQRVDFYLDSRLVVNQLNGVFKVKNPKLRELVLKIRNLEQEVGAEIFYHYIPREKNIAHHSVEEGFRL
ncbi:ribonuclease HI family protein [Candidatus Microgenomates bacterium]|nr:ribonuclease HI family protein [Candidatus Microgenomates bacterium]